MLEPEALERAGDRGLEVLRHGGGLAGFPPGPLPLPEGPGVP